MRKLRWVLPVFFLNLIASPGFSASGAPTVGGELTVAAAADLNSALTEIAAGFKKQTGITVKLSFGASGALAQQIQNGAPFDLFFSADMDYPKQLADAGQAEASSLYRYAVGGLVLWVPADSPLDVEHKGMNVLADPAAKKIAIANPQHAPYGRAAVAAMKHVRLHDQVSDRLVMGENVSQAAQFVESGNAQVGFVALAHVTSLAIRSRRKKQAAAFVEYIKTAESANILSRYGFTLPAQPERK